MLIVAFIWILFGGIAISVGVEKEETWQDKFHMGTVVDHLRRVLLIVGGIVSAATIISSFYFFVFKNAIIIFVSWVVVFLLVRLFIEIMVRSMGSDELPPPISHAPQVAAVDNFNDAVSPEGLKEVDDVEEIESNIEFASVSTSESVGDDNVRSGWENTHEAQTKVVPLSHRGESTIEKPQLQQGDPRGSEYNELFERINNPDKPKPKHKYF